LTALNDVRRLNLDRIVAHIPSGTAIRTKVFTSRLHGIGRPARVAIGLRRER
jgi:hypothetical protein